MLATFRPAFGMLEQKHVLDDSLFTQPNIQIYGI